MWDAFIVRPICIQRWPTPWCLILVEEHMQRGLYTEPSQTEMSTGEFSVCLSGCAESASWSALGTVT
jgi:hypothetical protein